MEQYITQCPKCNACDDTYVSYCFWCDYKRPKAKRLVQETVCPDCGICSLTESITDLYCSNCDFRTPKPPPRISTLDPQRCCGKQKPQLQLIPPALNREVAKALVCGHKYGPWNWRDNAVEIMTYLGAMKRHIDQIIDRVDEGDIDPESGAHHLGHVAAGCGIVLDAMQCGTLVDNRPRGRREGRKE